MKKRLLAYLLLLLVLYPAREAFSQTGIGTITPDIQAMLDIHSTQGGLLLPRLNTAQLTTLSATLTGAQAGMLVTDATTGRPIYWTGTAWAAFSGNTATATTPLNVSSTNTLAINPGTAPGDLITWDGVNWINTQPATQHFNVTVDNLQPFLVINYCIALVGIYPSRNSDEPFLSEIELFGFNFAPKGWALCNGQLLPINSNVALFSLIGTFYGGNGTTNFALPNLQGRVPLHAGTGNGLSSFTVGQNGGLLQNTISQ